MEYRIEYKIYELNIATFGLPYSGVWMPRHAGLLTGLLAPGPGK